MKSWRLLYAYLDGKELGMPCKLLIVVRPAGIEPATLSLEG